MSQSAEPPLTDRTLAAPAQGQMGARAGEPRNYVGIVRAVVLVVLAAVALTTPGFLSQPSILSLLTTVSFIGCVAVGMTLITISGNIMSFALGALVGATAMVFVLAANWGGFAFGLVAGLAFAAASNAGTPVRITSVIPNATITPKPTPTRDKTKPCISTRPKIFFRRAPSAMRIPSSRVRRPTIQAITP